MLQVLGRGLPANYCSSYAAVINLIYHRSSDQPLLITYVQQLFTNYCSSYAAVIDFIYYRSSDQPTTAHYLCAAVIYHEQQSTVAAASYLSYPQIGTYRHCLSTLSIVSTLSTQLVVVGSGE